ncbi:MAG: hypothetical protein OHK0026_04620 [Rhodocyclaceae bacterium]
MTGTCTSDVTGPSRNAVAPNARLDHVQFVPALNGLRGVAISSVLVFHASESALSGGFLGVDLFFVLSGFLITWLLATEHDRYGRIGYLDFYARRVLRLAPALLAFLAVFVLASFAMRKRGAFVSDLQDAGIALAYLSNWAMAFDIHPPNYVRHTWSLSIEEQFYLLWPVSLAAILRLSPRRSAAAWGCLALTVAVAAWRAWLAARGVSWARLYNGLDTRADALLAGATLALFLRAAGHDERRRIGGSALFGWIAAAAACLLAGALALSYASDPALHRWKLLAVELLAAILILDTMVSPRSLVRRALGFSPLVWIGAVSYGLYLWHYPILRLLREAGWRGGRLFVAGTLASLAVTAISYYALERPVLRLKSRFQRVRTDEAAASVS